MGLISDRKAKKQKEKELEKLKNAQNRGMMVGKGGGPMMVGRYPAGYYTTPSPHSTSWSHNHHGGSHQQLHHPAQPRQQPNVNPRYQTWVAPRKQPHLGQLVSVRRNTFKWCLILVLAYGLPSMCMIFCPKKHLTIAVVTT